jgi:hypothetical protein
MGCRCYFNVGGILEVLFHCAQLRGSHQGGGVLFGEVWGDLDFQVDPGSHTGLAVGMHALDDAETFRRKISLLAKGQYVKTSAGADGSQKEVKWRGGAGLGRLVGVYSKLIEVSVDALVTGEVNGHFHESNPPIILNEYFV